jgi:hypothetical protein
MMDVMMLETGRWGGLKRQSHEISDLGSFINQPYLTQDRTT